MHRVPNGRHPYFFEDKAIDQLLAMVSALAGELSVVHERNDALERVLESRGLLDRRDLDTFAPDAGAQAERDAWREELLSRVYRILEVERTNLARMDTPERYEAVIAELADESV
jgi:hypothetical protein